MALSDAEILTHLYNSCDPVKPADERFYVDCTEVRGGAIFASKLCIELSQTNGRIHALFTGHIGCGKSSELQHLADKMGQRTPLEDQKRFFPVIVNMSEYLDEYDVSTTDILLAVVTELADALQKHAGIELKDSYLQRRWEEVRGFLTSDVEVNEGELAWGWGKAKVQRLRTDPTARKQVRDTLLPQTTSLLDEINLAFVEARTKLKALRPTDGAHPYHDFVLILDNLEKIQRLAGNPQGEASQRALFIEGAPQLTALDAHVVYTVPLSLVRSTGNQLMLLYSKELHVLPMIKTEQRGPKHLPYPAGLTKLTALLQRRVPTGTALGDVIIEEALDFLLKYSGGHVRNLMLFTREATLYANRRLPISLTAVQRAIAQTVSVLEPSLSPGDWDLLAELERSPRQKWDNNAPEQRRLLENLCVMEYINGGDENPLKKTAPWYAVNPILREQDAFEDAMERYDRKAQQSQGGA